MKRIKTIFVPLPKISCYLKKTMKKQTKFSIAFAILSSIFLFSSCENELKTTGEFKEIPVVYGLLNWQDSAQYIRIERAFLDDKIGATVLAANADNLYFKDAEVHLLKVNNANNQIAQDIVLQKVDGTQEGYPRATGIFANTPNFLYKTKETLDTSSYITNTGNGSIRTDKYRYRLTILNKESGKTYTAETRLIPEFFLSLPQAGSTTQSWIAEVSAPKYKTFEVTVAPRNSSSFDMDLHFQYTEKNLNTGAYENKNFVWKLARNLHPVEGKVSIKIDHVQLYNTLNTYIPVKGNEIVRCGRSLRYNVYVYAAGAAYSNYKETITENTGVSSSDIIPQYTNITDGRGFFSSRCLYKSDAFLFNPTTIDSIAGSYRTAKLNFTRFSSSICP